MSNPKANKNTGNSPLQKWHDELVRHLVALLETTFEKSVGGHLDLAHIVDVIYIDQTRAPWPGSYLSPPRRDAFRDWLLKNTKLLLYAHENLALMEFASKLSSRLLRELSAAQISSTFYNDESEKKAQLEHMIRQEFQSHNSPEETISRSVQRYLRTSARLKRHQEEIKAPENDPLRDMLGLPRIGRSLLPREDIRVHMAKFVSKAKFLANLPDLPQLIESALGEFGNYCTFAGFVDKKHTVVLLDVKSTGAAQELTFNKVHLLARFRKISALKAITDFQFRVRPSSYRAGA